MNEFLSSVEMCSFYFSVVFVFIDSLAEELETAGIFTNVVQVEPGVWEGSIDMTCIFNDDETPQFVNYGVDGTPNGLVFTASGET